MAFAVFAIFHFVPQREHGDDLEVPVMNLPYDSCADKPLVVVHTLVDAHSRKQHFAVLVHLWFRKRQQSSRLHRLLHLLQVFRVPKMIGESIGFDGDGGDRGERGGE